MRLFVKVGQTKLVKVKVFLMEFGRMAVESSPTSRQKPPKTLPRLIRQWISTYQAKTVMYITCTRNKIPDSCGQCNVEFPTKKQRFLLVPVVSARMALSPALISSSHSHSLQVAWITVQEVRRHIIVFGESFIFCWWLIWGLSFWCNFWWFGGGGMQAS